jgi:hypothetical protein
MTISALVGSDDVVRWPRRALDGSLCQNALVESGVGKLAVPDGQTPRAMTALRGLELTCFALMVLEILLPELSYLTLCESPNPRDHIWLIGLSSTLPPRVIIHEDSKKRAFHPSHGP